MDSSETEPINSTETEKQMKKEKKEEKEEIGSISVLQESCWNICDLFITICDCLGECCKGILFLCEDCECDAE